MDTSNNASWGYRRYAAVNDPIKSPHLIPLSTNSTQLESPHINWTFGVRNPSEAMWLFRATRFPLRTAHTSVHSFWPRKNHHTPYYSFLSSTQWKGTLMQSKCTLIPVNKCSPKVQLCVVTEHTACSLQVLIPHHRFITKTSEYIPQSLFKPNFLEHCLLYRNVNILLE